MKKKFVLIPALFAALALGAQEPDGETPKTPEQREKEFYESIDRQVERLTEALDLADWQIFYVDSILTHDAKAMRAEAEALSKNKASSPEPYIVIQDRWMEQTDRALRKVFNDEQWGKYLKGSAGKARKAREKRAAKRAKKQGL